MNTPTLDENKIKQAEGIVESTDPLYLDLSDDKLVSTFNDRLSKFKSYYKEKKLFQRQQKNWDFYLGDQWEKKSNKEFAYMENVVYEGLERIKPIAMSRLPDMTVKGGGHELDKLVTDIVNTDIKRRKNRKVLGLALKTEPLDFFSVIKARWNPEKGRNGDYEFVNIPASRIMWDHNCKTPNADDMFLVGENADLTAKELIMMFPKKKAEILKKLSFDKEKDEESQLASPILIWEVWFHWFKEVPGEGGEQRWEKINGLFWKWDELILAKMKNPYFDFEGKNNYFIKEAGVRRKLTDDEVVQNLFGNQEMENEKVYNNYFDEARKPYFFMVYEWMGNDAIGITSRVEQIQKFQQNINLTGKQIADMNSRTAGKPVFNTQAIDKTTISQLDWKDPNQAVGVDGQVGGSFTHVAMPAAPQQLYASKTEDRNIAFEMLGVNATTRGLRQDDSTLGQDQMAREADYGLIDDIVEETINDASEWQAQWAMQFIKLFYTVGHFRDVIGKDGDQVFMAINQDVITDGMVVTVSASGVDKLMRKRMAIQNMNAKISDPLSYYEDTEQSNPKERAMRAILFNTAPQLYAQQYLADVMPEAPVVPPPVEGEVPPEDSVPPEGSPPVPPVEPSAAPMV